MRLLFYFPETTGPMIAKRLRSVDIKARSGHGSGTAATREELDAWMHREVSNGVRTDEFVGAVAWSGQADVQAAIRHMFQHTDDIDIMLAALPGVRDDPNLVRQRIQAFLDVVPREEGGAYGDGYNLLVALVQLIGEEAASTIQQFMNEASALRCYTVTQLFRNVRGDWCVEILVSLLDDQRPVSRYTLPIDSTDQDNRLPIRVCDAAAQALQQQRPELRYVMQGTHEQLDAQIDAIRAVLSHDSD
jgi:hypothetical protein